MRSRSRIKTQTLSRKMLGSVGIPLLVRFRRQTTNSTYQSRYCLEEGSQRPGDPVNTIPLIRAPGIGVSNLMYFIDLASSQFLWTFYCDKCTRIEIHAWLSQKMLGPFVISYTGHLRRQVMNSTFAKYVLPEERHLGTRQIAQYGFDISYMNYYRPV